MKKGKGQPLFKPVLSFTSATTDIPSPNYAFPVKVVANIITGTLLDVPRKHCLGKMHSGGTVEVESRTVFRGKAAG